jgi:hypothetical protein
MYSYHLYIAGGYIANTQIGCRETLLWYYRNNINHTRKEYRPNKIIYFGHRGVVPTEVIDRYLDTCNTIWKGKVDVELVKLKDINDCSQTRDYRYTSYKDTVLMKVRGAVNPLDLSCVLKMSWFKDKMGTTEFAKYVCAKKYSDLITNDYLPFSSRNRYINGPEVYIGYLNNWNRTDKLTQDINSLYQEHQNEFII